MTAASEPARDRIRLAFGAFLWRSFALLAVVGELALWAAIRREGRGVPPRFRVAWLIGYTPRTLFLAFFLAAVLTVAVDLFVRVVLDRQVRRRLAPASDRDDGDDRGFGFHLAATERVSDALPARRLEGRGGEPGTLVLTDRALWFFPTSWHGEPWSVPRDRIRSVRAEPASGPLGRLIRGLPPQVAIEAVAGPDAPTRFALAEPGRLLGRLGAEAAGIGGPNGR